MFRLHTFASRIRPRHHTAVRCLRTGNDVNIYKVKPGEELRAVLKADLDKERHELILERVANCINCLNENAYGKVLQFYPESHDVLRYMGLIKKLEFSGVSAFPQESNIPIKNRQKFQNIHHIDIHNTTKLPFNENAYAMVVHCMPFCSTAPQAEHPFAGCVDPDELLRIADIDGHVMIGCPADVWDRWDMTNQLQNTREGKLKVVQTERFNPSRIDPATGAIIDNDDDIECIADEDDSQEAYDRLVRYTWGVLKKESFGGPSGDDIIIDRSGKIKDIKNI